jgi:Peptidase family M48
VDFQPPAQPLRARTVRNANFRLGTAIVLTSGVTPILRLPLILLTALTCGCAGSLNEAQWTSDHGGLIYGPRQQRAERALARLKSANGLASNVTVGVLDSDQAGAYSWRRGAIFVTRGLIDAVDDDELTAAIAHEAGHLLLAGQNQRASSLDGCRWSANGCAAEDVEVAADAVASELLRRSTGFADALPRLLNELIEHPLTPANCREHLKHRISKLPSPAPDK